MLLREVKALYHDSHFLSDNARQVLLPIVLSPFHLVSSYSGVYHKTDNNFCPFS